MTRKELKQLIKEEIKKLTEDSSSDYEYVMKQIKLAKKAGKSEISIMIDMFPYKQSDIFKLQNKGYRIKANGDMYDITW